MYLSSASTAALYIATSASFFPYLALKVACGSQHFLTRPFPTFSAIRMYVGTSVHLSTKSGFIRSKSAEPRLSEAFYATPYIPRICRFVYLNLPLSNLSSPSLFFGLDTFWASGGSSSYSGGCAYFSRRYLAALFLPY